MKLYHILNHKIGDKIDLLLVNMLTRFISLLYDATKAKLTHIEVIYL